MSLRKPPPKKQKQLLLESAEDPETAVEEAALYEKDMTTPEAMQDVYYVLLAALLNVSVLKPVQPLMAKKGHMVLLGTSTLMQGRVSGTAKPNPREEQLLFVCSAIVQNISNHPSNRTVLYKAELRGSLAMDKLIEGAVESVDEELRQTAALLPPIHSPKGPGGVFEKSPPKSKRMSPNGAVLNSSVDVGLANSMRPKVGRGRVGQGCGGRVRGGETGVEHG